MESINSAPSGWHHKNRTGAFVKNTLAYASDYDLVDCSVTVRTQYDQIHVESCRFVQESLGGEALNQ